MNRRPAIDVLRGLMLVLMTVTHLPTRFSDTMGQPLGFVSTAEGFVLLSAFLVGQVYSRKSRRDGPTVMRAALWRRAWTVYLCQLAMLVFLFALIAPWGVHVAQPAVTDMLAYFLQQPASAAVAGALLVYQPPLMDILTMYVLFMVATPWVLSWGLRHGWRGPMAASLVLWLLSLGGLSEWIYGLAAQAGLTVPYAETGAFATLSWQLIWMIGLWMGASYVAPGARMLAVPCWAVVLAAAAALAGFAGRHWLGQVPPDAGLAVLLDKWQLGPLRLLNLLALLMLATYFGPRLEAPVSRLRWLASLDAHRCPCSARTWSWCWWCWPPLAGPTRRGRGGWMGCCWQAAARC